MTRFIDNCAFPINPVAGFARAIRRDTGYRAGPTLPGDFSGEEPFVRLNRQGGSAPDEAIERWVLEAELFVARHNNVGEDRMWSAASTLREAVLALHGETLPDGTFVHVGTHTTPVEVPSSNPNLRRCLAMFSVVTAATPRSTP